MSSPPHHGIPSTPVTFTPIINADRILKIQPCSTNIPAVDASDSMSALDDRHEQLANQ
ncbi:hypothetical protein CLF_112496, partial [Clonorchis sinensis]